MVLEAPLEKLEPMLNYVIATLMTGQMKNSRKKSGGP